MKKTVKKQSTTTLNTLSPVTYRKSPKRRGRGDASGHGGTSTRGHKGQKARAGGYHKMNFEGGQMPLARRLPKRGFTNIFRKELGIVNLEKLSTLPKGTEVTLDLAKEKGWVSNKAQGLKILADGELKHPLKIKTAKVSKAAKAKIEAAGGTFS
ncbi:MAG: 50S ribosomal protein L15 [Deltaproteobacteria bacterium]|nr:50S ribosomal protein L15 [Deltaproteobacteria bacterium]MDZ4224664.1 50S ribosomal protein L15 [bacterium]